MGGRGGSAWRIYIYIYIYIYRFLRGGSIVRENVYSLHGFPHVHVHEHRLRRGARHAEERIRCGRTNRVCQCDTSSSTEFLSRIECVCVCCVLWSCVRIDGMRRKRRGGVRGRCRRFFATKCVHSATDTTDGRLDEFNMRWGVWCFIIFQCFCTTILIVIISIYMCGVCRIQRETERKIYTQLCKYKHSA